MKTIPDLPDELILHILEEVHPDDLGSFSQTCRHIHGCARGHVKKHRELEHQYSEVVLRWSEPDSDDHAYHFRHPIFLLEKIWNEPMLAHHIKRFEVNGSDMVMPPYASSEEEALDLDIMEQVQSTLAKCRNTQGCLTGLQPPHVQVYGDTIQWLDLFQNGDRGASFTTLLSSLSSLQCLQINDFIFNNRLDVYHFDEAIRSLPQLHTIELYTLYEDPETSIQDLLGFSLFPNIRHLKGRQLNCMLFDEEWLDCFLEEVYYEVSNVKSIEITLGFGNFALLLAMKDRFVHLTHLRISFERREIFDVFALVQELREAFCGQLKSLALISSTRPVDEACTFRDFKSLQELEIDVVSLYRSRPGESEPLATFTPRLIYTLPPSLESLFLNVRRHEDAISLLFRGFAKHWKDYLPNLRTVTLAGTNGSRLKNLTDELIASGLRVERQWSWVSKPQWLSSPPRL